MAKTKAQLGLYRCPFLALSATIGNPEELTSWLQDVKLLQQQQDQSLGLVRPASTYTVRLIKYSERFADLRCYRYDSSSRLGQNKEDQDSHEQDFGQTLHRMHPYAVLELHMLQNGSFPPLLTLEPSDCLQLFESMQAALSECPDAEWLHSAQQAISELAPSTFFHTGSAIPRQQVREWEAALKAELLSWVSAASMYGVQAAGGVLQQLKAASVWSSGCARSAPRHVQPDDFHTMMKGLDQKGMLPAIAFTFDRQKCNILCR